MNKKEFIKNRPFRPIDAMEMLNFVEDEIREIIKNIFKPGIINGFTVNSLGGLDILVSSGNAIDEKYNVIYLENDSTLKLDKSDSEDRIDIVTIKYESKKEPNYDTDNEYGFGSSYNVSNNILDSIRLNIKKGTPSEFPIKPELSEGEILICSILVKKDENSIVVSDERKFTSVTKEPVVSNIEPNTGLYEGLIWYNPEKDETKVFLNGLFREIGGGGRIEHYSNTIILDSDTQEILIGLSSYNPLQDILLVYKGGMFLQKEIDYKIDKENNKIIKTKNSNDEDQYWEKNTIFDFFLIRSVTSRDTLNNTVLEKIYIVENDNTTNIPILIPEFNPETDILTVSQENLKLYRNEQWKLNDNKISIDLLGYSAKAGERFEFSVMKRVSLRHETLAYDGALLLDNTVYNNKLGRDIKVGSLATLLTNAKDNITDAINELFKNKLNKSEVEEGTGKIPRKNSNNLLNADRLNNYYSRIDSEANTVAVRDSAGDLSAKRFFSTAPEGVPPLSIISEAKVSRLNSDMVDGYHATTPGGIEYNRVAVTDLYGRVGDSNKIEGLNLNGLDNRYKNQPPKYNNLIMKLPINAPIGNPMSSANFIPCNFSFPEKGVYMGFYSFRLNSEGSDLWETFIDNPNFSLSLSTNDITTNMSFIASPLLNLKGKDQSFYASFVINVNTLKDWGLGVWDLSTDKLKFGSFPNENQIQFISLF